MQWQVAKIFSVTEKGELIQGKEGLGLVGFGGILTETIGSRRLIGERLKTKTRGC